MFKLILMSILLTGSIYDFKVESIDGGKIDFSKYKGKKILIVNTASNCGHTGQYADLEALYKKYKDKLVIIGFPANNFGGQEPGNNKEIQEFCTSKFSVTFPMAAKISVLGTDMHPLYKWLTTESKKPVTWNFQKYLINEKGKLVAVFDPGTSPRSPEIIAAIEK